MRRYKNTLPDGTTTVLHEDSLEDTIYEGAWDAHRDRIARMAIGDVLVVEGESLERIENAGSGALPFVLGVLGTVIAGFIVRRAIR